MQGTFVNSASLKKYRWAIVAAVLCLGLGFYGGMRYQSYRIKKAVGGAVAALGQAFGSGLSGGSAVTGADARAGSVAMPNPLNAALRLTRTYVDFENLIGLATNIVVLANYALV